MKKLLLSSTAALLALSSAFAEQNQEKTTVDDVMNDISFTTSVGYVSEYASFRAQKRSAHAIQSTVEANYAFSQDWDAYAGIFTNSPAKGDYMTEVDPYLGVSFKVYDDTTLDMGVTHYRYIKNDTFFNRSHSTEIFLGASFDSILSPALYAFYDFNLKQVVIESSIGYRLDLAEYGFNRLSIDSGLYTGYLHASNWGRVDGMRKNHYWYMGAKADLVIKINENSVLRVGPRVSANDNGKDGLANVNGRSTTKFGVATSLTMGF